MEGFMESIVGVIFVVLVFGLPVIAIVMACWTAMHKKSREKEIKQLIIENKTDPETARILLEGKKKKETKLGNVDLSTLRTACMMLGIGLGALITWLCGVSKGNIYFWLIIAFGIGVGMLVSFIVELYLTKKYSKDKPADPPVED